MAGPTIGYATMQIVPSMRGVRAAIAGDGDWDRAGDDAGDRVSRSFGSRLGSGLATAAKVGAIAFTAALAGGIALGSQSIDAASNLAETMSKSNTVFGESARAVEEWSQTSSTAFGQSQQQALEAASSFGNMFAQLGIGSGQAAGMSLQMTELASDFASFHNADITEVLTAQQAAFRGEYDALQRFVPTINAAAVEMEALRMTGKETTAELTAQDKALAAQSLMLANAGDAMGDFARTSDGLANKQRIMSAQFQDLKARIGQALIPAMSAVVGIISTKVIPKVGELADEWMPRLREAFASVVDWVQANWPTMQAILQALWDGLQSAWTNIVQPVLALLLDAFRAVSAWIVENWPQISATATQVFATLSAAAQTVVDWFKENWPQIRATIEAVVAWLRDEAWPVVQQIIGLLVAEFGGLVAWVQENWPKIRQTVEDVITAIRIVIETTVAVIREIWARWGEEITTIISTTWETIKSVIQAAIDVVRGIIDTVTALIRGDWSAAWEGIKTILQGVLDAIVAILQGFVTTVTTLLSVAWQGIGAAFGVAWEGFKGIVSGAVDGIVGFIQGIPGKLLEWVGALGDAAASLGGAIWDGLIGAVEGLGDAIWNAIKGGFNSIIGAWNGLSFSLPEVDTHIPGVGKVGGWSIDTPNLPYFHDGGIVGGARGQDILAVLQAGEMVVDAATTRMLTQSAGTRAARNAPLIGEVHNHNNVDADGFWRGANALAALV
jgi:phage-related protein